MKLTYTRFELRTQQPTVLEFTAEVTYQGRTVEDRRTALEAVNYWNRQQFASERRWVYWVN